MLASTVIRLLKLTRTAQELIRLALHVYLKINLMIQC